jgi:hypothetical protein
MRIGPDDDGSFGQHDPAMFGSTYAVSWCGANGARCAGRLDIDDRALRLTGASNGCEVREAIPFREIDNVRLEDGRLRIIRRKGRSFSIGSLDAPGVLHELAERLALRDSFAV